MGFRPSKTNYTSVARLNFTSGADTATENVLLVGKSTGDAIVNVGGNVQSVMQLAIPNTSGTFGTFVPGVGTNYNTALPATVTTTTGDAALSVTDHVGDRPRPSGQRGVLAGLGAAGARGRPRRQPAAGVRAAQRDGRRAAPAQELERAGHVRSADARPAPGDRRDRGAAGGHVQQVPDVHAVHHDPVSEIGKMK